MQLEDVGRVIETEVLVLGGGAAGLLAAIGAREQGAKVLIVDKGVIDTSGCMGHGFGEFCCHFNYDENDTDEAHARFMAKPPFGYSYRIALETFSHHVYPMLKRMEAIGWQFQQNPDGTYHRQRNFAAPGRGYGVRVANGTQAKRLLATEVLRSGAETVGHIQLTKILTNKGRAVGAVGFNIRTAEFYIFRAKTVVCTMGCYVARVRANNSTGNPFNCWKAPSLTGSGIVLPYEAGAKVVGLDNLGGVLATIIPKGFGQIGCAWFNVFGCPVTNAFGERFLDKVPGGLAGERSVANYQAYKEQCEGRAPLFVNCQRLSPEDYDALYRGITTAGHMYQDYWQQRGVDFSTDPMELEQGEIADGGMLLKDERGELEPAGRGLFGSTVALVSSAMCGGYVAGTEAAKEAQELNSLIEVDTAQAEGNKVMVLAPLERKDGYTPKQFEDMIRQVMNHYAGFVRNEVGMRTGFRSLKLLEEHANEIKADNPHQLLRANEAVTLLKHCLLALPAGIERKESGRGQYFVRSDYPDRDPAWDHKFVVQWQEEGEAKMEVITTDSIVD